MSDDRQVSMCSRICTGKNVIVTVNTDTQQMGRGKTISLLCYLNVLSRYRKHPTNLPLVGDSVILSCVGCHLSIFRQKGRTRCYFWG